MARAARTTRDRDGDMLADFESLDNAAKRHLLDRAGFIFAMKPLDASQTGIIVKVFTKSDFEKGKWENTSTDAHGCEIWTAKAGDAQIDVYEPTNLVFPQPQSHKYKKGGHVKVCGNTVTLFEDARDV